MPTTIEIPTDIVMTLPIKYRMQVLFRYVDPDVYLTRDQIAYELGLSRRTIERGLEELETDGLLTSKELPRKRRAALGYRVTPLPTVQ